jgi:MYXO-CTERM domain-containing protein
MTDPNGDTCAWTPGSDGFCPSDSGSSSPPHTTTYLSPVGVLEADHIRLAMTRSETGERPQIETAVFAGVEEPEHAPVRLDGEVMPGTIVPQLAAIDDRVYLAWSDLYAGTVVGAPLREGGTVIAEEIVNFGARDGRLRRLGDRFVFVSATTSEILGTWVDREGRVEKTTVLASPALTAVGFDVSDDGAGGALAIAFHTYDKASSTSGLSIARVFADGTTVVTPIVKFEKYDNVTFMQVTGTSDGGALAALGLYRENRPAPAVVRVAPDGTVTTEPTTLASVTELVRNGTAVLAISSPENLRSEARVLDERGTILSGPFRLPADRSAAAFATPGGFTLLHETSDAAVALTSLDTSGFPAPPIAIAHTSTEGCGCRTTNSDTAGLFAITFAFVLRRRVRRAA